MSIPHCDAFELDADFCLEAWVYYYYPCAQTTDTNTDPGGDGDGGDGDGGSTPSPPSPPPSTAATVGGPMSILSRAPDPHDDGMAQFNLHVCGDDDGEPGRPGRRRGRPGRRGHVRFEMASIELAGTSSGYGVELESPDPVEAGTWAHVAVTATSQHGGGDGGGDGGGGAMFTLVVNGVSQCSARFQGTRLPVRSSCSKRLRGCAAAWLRDCATA